ncbi:MAG TPA: NF038122 family metalloprotease [Micropepsaceae bacterium]|nr:NF038122 family metalloprotease [Micropepsaceae bacterium]
MGWVVSFFANLKADVEWLITSLAVAPATSDSAAVLDGMPAATAGALHANAAPDGHGTVLALADQQADVTTSADVTPAQHATADDAAASGVQDIAFTLPQVDNLVILADLTSDAQNQSPSAPLTPLSPPTDNVSTSDAAVGVDPGAHQYQDFSPAGAPFQDHSDSHWTLPNSGADEFAMASLAPQVEGFAHGGGGGGGSGGGSSSGVTITSNNGGTTPFVITLFLDSNLSNLQTSNPGEYTQITNDLQTVANFFASHFTNNPNDPTHPQHSFLMNVGWGEAGGSALPSGVVGASSYNLYAASYSWLQQGFTNIAEANETASGSQVVNIPGSEPFSSSNPTFMITAAEKHALNITQITGTQYGGVGFSSAANTFFFDPSHPVAGEYDFMGIVAQEMSEVLGRDAMNGAGKSNELMALDLFHFADSNGAPIYSGTTPGYFSVDNGTTNLMEFNTGSGDHGDWAANADAFAANPATGVDLPFSYADYLAMEAAGYSGNFHYDTSLAQTTADWNNALGSF